MTWHCAVDKNLYKCGSCGYKVAKGEPFGKTRTGLVRCLECAKKIEQPPDVIEDAREASVPAGIEHQASLEFSR